MDCVQTETGCAIVQSVADAVLRTEALKIGYPGERGQEKLVAEDLTLTLSPGELVCLIGPNGVGKSTLIRTLVGLQKALSGSVYLDNRPLSDLTVKEVAQRVSVVLTQAVQGDAIRVRELVELGRFPYTGVFDRLSAEDHVAVERALELTGAGLLAERFLHELSDGERQRVMIARALAQGSLLLVLDEPTAFLDLPGRVATIELLHRLARTEGRAVLSSTHDLDLALRHADRIWLMDSTGRLSVGAPEDLVLFGDFDQAFNREGVHFDRERGVFASGLVPEQAIFLQAEGLEQIWTERALNRAGFAVFTECGEDLPLVRFLWRDGQRVWVLRRGYEETEHFSIYDLLQKLTNCFSSLG